MKATELMIGDLLTYRGQHNVFDFRVEQITKHKVGYHAEPCENRMHYLRLHEVEPIPLTADILERNGFKRSGTNYIMADDYYDIVVHEISDSIWDVQYTNCEMPVGNQQMCVCHVHQLQHALRMCNEEIEIEL